MQSCVIMFIISISMIFKIPVLQKENTQLLAMFWNLENFFDWKDTGISDSDREFSSLGDRRWTKSRFYAKRNAIVKSILWIADKAGHMPDAIGFAEVENSDVVRAIAKSDALKKYGYDYIHYDSPDPRGIDVALIYRKEVLELIDSRPVKVGGKQNISKIGLSLDDFKTRDILYTEFRHYETGKKIYLLVNHHPSKYGGSKRSELKRLSAVLSLKHVCDSLKLAESGNIVAMGDFNDDPDSDVFRMLENVMYCLANKKEFSGKGTIKFRGRREMIDLFFVSQSLLPFSKMKIVEIPFLLEPDKAFSGMKPKRTYSGPRYLGGVSDHLPILIYLSTLL